MTMLCPRTWKPLHDLDVWKTKRQLLKGLAQLLTRQDIARMCQIDQRTLSNWMRRRYIPEPIYVAPHSPRWMPDEMERWLTKRLKERGPVNRN